MTAVEHGITGTGAVFDDILRRMPRGSTLNFRTFAGALATFRLSVITGLFPESLGQDIGT